MIQKIAVMKLNFGDEHMFLLCPFYQHVRKLDGLVKRVHIDFNAYYEVKVTKQSAEKSLKKQFGSKVRKHHWDR